MTQTGYEKLSPRPKLADVARIAGVSPATASKALSGRHSVSPAARERVLAAVEKLDFRPNRQAQDLARGLSGTVGLITHDLEGRFSIPIMMGAEDSFGADKVSVLLCNSRGDAIREKYHIDALLGRQVDGLIVVGARPDPRPSLGRLPVPVVYAYAPSNDEHDMSVIADNRGGGALAASHLIDCGREKIAIISGDASYGAATERVEGATRVLQAAGLEPVEGQALYGAWTEEWGRGAARALFERNPLPGQLDAILCGSDQIARGVSEALREMGVNVPGDIAVVGHDNWDIVAKTARPPITSIDMNLTKLGRHAAARLVEAIEGHMVEGKEIISPRLIVRGSTVF